MKDQRHKYLASFVKRGERPLSQARQKLVDNILPQIDIDDDFEFSKFAQEHKKVFLEIGFGAGEHLAQQAKYNPENGYIGCEIFYSGIASLIRYVDEYKLKNVRIWRDDARLLLETLPESTIDGIYILFPDPWPKTKHHKRRIMSSQTINLLRKILKKGGKLRFATDHMPYLRWTLLLMQQQEDFYWTAETSDDWNIPPKDHYKTRYEEKLKTGDSPVFLDYIFKG